MSQISPLMFYLSENELISWTYLHKMTPRRTKILTPVWNKILKIRDTLFELMRIEVQCFKNYFKVFYHKKQELLEITKKRNWKSHAPNWKICVLYIYREYLLCLQFNASVNFWQKCINFVEQRLTFSHFKGSIIP